MPVSSAGENSCLADFVALSHAAIVEAHVNTEVMIGSTVHTADNSLHRSCEAGIKQVQVFDPPGKAKGAAEALEHRLNPLGGSAYQVKVRPLPGSNTHRSCCEIDEPCAGTYFSY